MNNRIQSIFFLFYYIFSFFNIKYGSIFPRRYIIQERIWDWENVRVDALIT